MNLQKLMTLLAGLTFLIANEGLSQTVDKKLTLEESVQIGLNNNLEIMAAENEMKAAEGRAINVLGVKDPVVSGEWSEIPTGEGVNQYNERDYRISQSIDFPTNYIHRSKLGKTDKARQEMIYQETKLFVRTDIEKAYYRLVADYEKLNLVKQHIQLANTFYEKAKQRYDAGKTSYLDVSRAEISRSNVENEISVAKGNYISSKENLRALLALPDSIQINPSDTLLYKPLVFDEQSLINTALQNHPSLLIAGLTEQMAGRNLKLAKGSYLPNIEASAFSQKIGGNNFKGVEVGLSIPIWAPINQKGKVLENKGYYLAAQQRLKNEKNWLKTNIAGTYSKVEASRQQVVKYIENLLEQSRSINEMTLRSYEEGKVGYLKVLDAQALYIHTIRNYIDALANYKSQVAELEKYTNQEIVQ